MAWGNSGRALPPDWPTIRRHIIQRDGHRCTWTQNDGTRCPQTTRLEVDHIGDPNNHQPHNLRTLCHWHHAHRTASQSAAAQSARRPAPKHPGLT